MSWWADNFRMNEFVLARLDQVSDALGGRDVMFLEHESNGSIAKVACEALTLTFGIERDSALQCSFRFPCSHFGVFERNVAFGDDHHLAEFLDECFEASIPERIMERDEKGRVTTQPGEQFEFLTSLIALASELVLFDQPLRDIFAAYYMGRTVAFNERHTFKL